MWQRVRVPMELDVSKVKNNLIFLKRISHRENEGPQIIFHSCRLKGMESVKQTNTNARDTSGG